MICSTEVGPQIPWRGANMPSGRIYIGRGFIGKGRGMKGEETERDTETVTRLLRETAERREQE